MLYYFASAQYDCVEISKAACQYVAIRCRNFILKVIVFACTIAYESSYSLNVFVLHNGSKAFIDMQVII